MDIKMTDYKSIAEFFEDHEDEIVVIALKKYYDLCNRPDKIDNSDMVIEPDQESLDAISLVLKDFMSPTDYLRWINSIKTRNELD